MKKLNVDLEYIAICMDDEDRYDQNYYLDTETGETIVIPREVVDALDEEESLKRLPEGELKLVDLARDILSGNPRYVEIPIKRSKEALSDLLDFAEKIPDQRIKDRISLLFHGKGAWRKFRELLQESPALEREWSKFKEEKEKKNVLAWLHGLGIEPTAKNEEGN